MTLFQFLDQHPWWALLYLSVFCVGIQGLVYINLNVVTGSNLEPSKTTFTRKDK